MLRSLTALLAMLMLGGCTGLFFQPMNHHVRTPADIGLKHEDVELRASDGVALLAGCRPATAPARATVLFLHGNAENISTHIAAVSWMPAAGFDVLLLDYRGYGRSSGVPTVEGAMRDIDAATRHLLGRVGIRRDRMVLFGQSLGGSLAAWYAARGPRRHVFSGVVVDSAFSSYREIARDALDTVWWTRWAKWPASYTIDDSFSPVSVVGEIAPVPVLFMAGGRDRIVPPAHSKRLFAAANAPKAHWLFPEAGHIGALTDPQARERLASWIEEVVAR
jgi:pimeloyl-ACP methyl ester carboxylesterase